AAARPLHRGRRGGPGGGRRRAGLRGGAQAARARGGLGAGAPGRGARRGGEGGEAAAQPGELPERLPGPRGA
ncbi:unnamed protein product, partial [Prorocentrum cordatum]